MQILTLAARDFRNLAAVELSLDPRCNVIAGSNAQGKTNLLEAAYLALCQRSFRGARGADLIRFGRSQGQLRASVDVLGLVSEIQVHLEATRKRVTLDGKTLRGVAGGLGAGLAAVLFTPDDLQVPKGSPAERRRLLDRAVATVWADYTTLARDYTKALRTRNRVLRDPRGASEALLEVYDRQLSGLGAKVMLARQRYLRSLEPRFETAFARIIGDGTPAALRYAPVSAALEEVLAAPSSALPDVVQCFARELSSRRFKDRERRLTSAGPHADDLELSIAGRSARQFASQGQTRALVLAFKVAQILDTYDKLSHYPVLLLDDVSSELDARKNEYLFEFIDEISCQVLLTTTRPELLPLYKNRRDFSVLEGEVERR